MKGQELLELLQSCTQDELALDVVTDNGTKCSMLDTLIVATRGAAERAEGTPATKARGVRLVLTSNAVGERTIGYRPSPPLTNDANDGNLPPSEGG